MRLWVLALVSWWGALTGLLGCNERTFSPAPATTPPEIRDGGSETPPRLVLGLAPYFAREEMQKEFEPLAAYLGRAVGLPVELKVSDTYSGLPKELASFQVQMAVLSPFAYVLAKREAPDLVLLATQIADGSSSYAGYIVTRDDTGIESIEDLKRKKFAFVDRSSTSGYLYPLAFLKSQKIDPDTYFRRVSFAGDHSTLIDWVLGRRVDAGATFATAYKIAVAENPRGKRLKILAKTGRIPLDAFCASARLAQPLVDKLRDALLALSTRNEEGRQVLRGFSTINGFVAVGDEHYDDVRRVADFVTMD